MGRPAWQYTRCNCMDPSMPTIESSDDVATKIFDWQKTHAMGAGGTHRYTPEQFGLSADRIRGDYDFYIRRFDVPLEG